MVVYGNDGEVVSAPPDIFVNVKPLRLILVTHDESAFYANDRRKTKWIHSSQNAASEPKGKGQSTMVSDCLTSEWGFLRDGDR